MVKRKTPPMNVIVDMPERLPIVPDEFALNETYMRDIIIEMIRPKAANDNIDETLTDNSKKST